MRSPHKLRSPSSWPVTKLTDERENTGRDRLSSATHSSLLPLGLFEVCFALPSSCLCSLLGCFSRTPDSSVGFVNKGFPCKSQGTSLFQECSGNFSVCPSASRAPSEIRDTEIRQGQFLSQFGRTYFKPLKFKEDLAISL